MWKVPRLLSASSDQAVWKVPDEGTRLFSTRLPDGFAERNSSKELGLSLPSTAIEPRFDPLEGGLIALRK
jgi:hypothetical protein